MGADLPLISAAELAERLDACCGEPLEPEVRERLYIHYEELRRWNPRLSLVGPGTAAEVVERHFGESLAALPLIGPEVRRVLDIGSGAGFPGLVLAAALPGVEVTLVESRERKWAFLEAVRRRAALSCRCLNARVDAALLERGALGEPDRIIARAVKLPVEILASLADLLDADGAFLFWSGADGPVLPEQLAWAREVALPGSARRRIREACRDLPKEETDR